LITRLGVVLAPRLDANLTTRLGVVLATRLGVVLATRLVPKPEKKRGFVLGLVSRCFTILGIIFRTKVDSAVSLVD